MAAAPHILIIDDSLAETRILSITRKTRLSSEYCLQWSEGIEVAKSRKPDLIFMDVVMRT